MLCSLKILKRACISSSAPPVKFFLKKPSKIFMEVFVRMQNKVASP